jgi:hypothetical protein
MQRRRPQTCNGEAHRRVRARVSRKHRHAIAERDAVPAQSPRQTIANRIELPIAPVNGAASKTTAAVLAIPRV